MKYALDTNVFIDSFRSEEAQVELLAFLKRALPFTFMSAVVMQELFLADAMCFIPVQ